MLCFVVVSSQCRQIYSFSSCTGSDVMAFAALEQLLGAAPQIRWASNVTSNRMNAALTQKTSEPFNVSLQRQLNRKCCRYVFLSITVSRQLVKHI